jgi:hypothetical protein
MAFMLCMMHVVLQLAVQHCCTQRAGVVGSGEASWVRPICTWFGL